MLQVDVILIKVVGERAIPAQYLEVQWPRSATPSMSQVEGINNLRRVKEAPGIYGKSADPVFQVLSLFTCYGTYRNHRLNHFILVLWQILHSFGWFFQWPVGSCCFAPLFWDYMGMECVRSLTRILVINHVCRSVSGYITWTWITSLLTRFSYCQ